MHRSLFLWIRAVSYQLRGGFLVRPFAIAMAFGAVGMLLSSLEARVPAVEAWAARMAFQAQADPQTVELILSSIATSAMTVVSIVFAILLMTLTLASTQFSPRILVSFVRDKATQWTLGVLLGVFCYCITVLEASRLGPVPFTPILGAAGAMISAIAAIAWLIFFIHHISQAISVNHIVDRIARDTEQVIDALMPHAHGPFEPSSESPVPEGTGAAIVNPRSGYVRYVDLPRLMGLAKAWRIRIRVDRGVGQFVPAGAPLMWVNHEDRVGALRVPELLSAFDIGPTRTLQQDVEFGVIQIVDIGLRAISPAVNDPSTAISCIDQLSSILIRWCGRAPPSGVLFDPPHVPRVSVPWIGLEGLLQTAFDQLRHYAEADLAVNLRLLRAMIDIGSTTRRPDVREALKRRARLLVDQAAPQVGEPDAERLRQRLAVLEARLAG